MAPAAPRARAWCLYIAALDSRVRDRAVHCAEELGLRYQVLDRDRPVFPREAGAVYCVGSRLADRLMEIPEPALVVSVGAAVQDHLLVALSGKRAVAIRLSDLNAASLLQLLIRLTTAVDVYGLAGYLQSVQRFGQLPKKFLQAFVFDPTRMRALDDIAHAARGTRRDARAIVTAGESDQPEHLFVALKSESYSWLTAQGFARSAIEGYLGIGDRSTFRRACRRAGVAVPWQVIA